MAQGNPVLTDKECFTCHAKVDLEKVGTKPNGKAIWKMYEAGTNHVHEHGQATGEEFKKINEKLDQILNFLRGQGTLET